MTLELAVTVPSMVLPLLVSWRLGTRAALTGRMRALIVWSAILGVLFLGLRVLYLHYIDTPLEEPANPNRMPTPSLMPLEQSLLEEMLGDLDGWLNLVLVPSGVMFAPLFTIEAWLVYWARSSRPTGHVRS